MSVYVDSSALGVILRAEPEVAALLTWLRAESEPLVSTHLLETEMRRLAARHRLDQGMVTRLLAGISMTTIRRADFVAAGTIGDPGLRSLDALHLQGAMHLDARAVLTYDRRLGDAASALGFEVLAPA